MTTILSLLQDEEESVNGDEEYDEEINENVKNCTSHEETFKALETAMSWFEKQEEYYSTRLSLLKKMCDFSHTKNVQI